MNIGDVRLSAYGQSMLEAYRRQKLQEELETDGKKAKQAQPIFKAREKGVAFGRKPILSAEQRREIVRLNKEQNFSLKKLAQQFSISRATVCRVIKEDLEAFSKTEALNGVAFGRKPILTAEQRQEIVRLNKEEKLSLKELARQFCVSRATIYRMIKEASGTRSEAGTP